MPLAPARRAEESSPHSFGLAAARRAARIYDPRLNREGFAGRFQSKILDNVGIVAHSLTCAAGLVGQTFLSALAVRQTGMSAPPPVRGEMSAATLQQKRSRRRTPPTISLLRCSETAC